MMYRKVVVPLDLTVGAEAAIAHGAAIARQAGAALALVTVTPTYAGRDAVRRRLALTAERHGVLANVHAAAPGDVAATILEEADSADTLICLRTHARRLIGELTLGSVSEQVVRSCRHPILLIGPRCGPAPIRLESMVVALDGSERAEQILPTVAGWAKQLDVRVWLLQVLPGAGPLVGAGDDIHESSYVHRIADRLADDGIKAEWDTIHDRKPANAVTRFADGRRPSVIALTTHGRSGYGRLVVSRQPADGTLGSIALQVAHRATVPVLVARPDRVP